MKKYFCEFFGTLVLVLCGCGVAVFSGANLVSTALAFGLSIVAVAYVIGSVSGAHVNPAVSLAMWMDKRLSTTDLIGYVIAQVVGALAGAGILMIIINNTALGSIDVTGLGANGFESASATDITMLGAFVVEIVLTFIFVFSILGVTKDKEKSSVAPIVIGLSLVLVHLLAINLTGTSVNPARSLAPAIYLGGIALEQVWVFIIAPLIGGALAALAFCAMTKEEPKVTTNSKKQKN